MFSANNIVGRYAPSPTGDLHLGNLRTALFAWMHAVLGGGKFIVRMEDLDLPRVVAGSADDILHDLEWLGISWDGPVVYQSQRDHLYQNALEILTDKGLTYPCFCSRKEIRSAASAPHGRVGVYPGFCRNLSKQGVIDRGKQKNPSMRVQVPEPMSDEVGDFVIRRADKVFAYQLAVVVDDLDQGVTEIVRGADLLDSTDKQIYLAGLLSGGASRMRYLHAPLMLDDEGLRMSKRDGSLSAKAWRQQGNTVEQLLGYLAFSAGVLTTDEPISISELLTEVTLESLSAILC